MNAFPPNTTTIAGVLLDEAVHARQTMEALRKPYAEALERAKSDAPPAPWRRGVGVAAVWQMANSARGDNAGGAWTGMDIGLTKGAVEIDENGRIRVLSGAVEKGQGISIALAQIAAEALDVPMAVMLPTYLGDTNSGYPIATSGQRTTFLVGGAILKASASLRSALVGVAADTFDVPPDDIEFADGWATVRSSSGISRMSLSELASGLSERGLPLKHESTYVFEKTETGTGPIYTWVSELVELDVNMETGDVKVDRVTFVVDAGKVINPQILEGQVEGGTVMSLGYALSEKFVPGETRTLKDYGLPTIKDAPRHTTMIALEIPAPGPFGLKGCAESTAGPGMPAIASAIAHAIGRHLYELPARPEVVLAAIHDSRSTAAEA
jgi:CO/xanthine dehydrogenase Mo-binding subunit